MIPTHDVAALADKTIYFLQNPNEARIVALAGCQRVAEVSNPEQIVNQMDSLLMGGL